MSEIIQITGKPAMFGKIENGHMPGKYKKKKEIQSNLVISKRFNFKLSIIRIIGSL